MKKQDNHIVDKNPTIRLHIWLETDNGVFFGMGRAQLLDNIEKYGSLKKASEIMGMSYRGAWGKIKKTEEILGFQLIKKISNKDGYVLTDDGKFFKDKYLAWLKDIEEHAYEKALEDFPWVSKIYTNLNDKDIKNNTDL